MTAAPATVDTDRPRPAARTRRPAAGYYLVAPAFLYLVLFFVAPTVYLFHASFSKVDRFNNMVDGYTLEHYRAAFVEPYLSRSVLTSLSMSVQVTLVCVVLGYIAAYAIVHSRSRTLKALMFAVVISPLLTSVIARSYGWIVLLANNGVVNQALVGAGVIDAPLRMLYTAPATVVAVAQVLIPFAILPVVSAFANVDGDLSRASSIMGAGALRTFTRIVLPLTAPGVMVGASLVFTLSMGIYITPLVVGGASQPLLSIRIYDQILALFNIPQGAALSFVLLVVTLTTVVAANAVFRIWSRRRLG